MWAEGRDTGAIVSDIMEYTNKSTSIHSGLIKISTVCFNLRAISKVFDNMIPQAIDDSL